MHGCVCNRCVCGQLYESAGIPDIFSWCESTSSYRKHVILKQYTLKYAAEELYRTSDEWRLSIVNIRKQKCPRMTNKTLNSDYRNPPFNEFASSASSSDHIGQMSASLIARIVHPVILGDSGTVAPHGRFLVERPTERGVQFFSLPNLLKTRWEWHTDAYCSEHFNERFKRFYDAGLAKIKGTA